MKDVSLYIIAFSSLFLTTSCEKTLDKASEGIIEKTAPSEIGLKKIQQTWVVDTVKVMTFNKVARPNQPDSIDIRTDSLITNGTMTFFKIPNLNGKFVHNYTYNGATRSDTNEYRPLYSGSSDPALAYLEAKLYYDKPCYCLPKTLSITTLTDIKFRLFVDERMEYLGQTTFWVRRIITLHR